MAAQSPAKAEVDRTPAAGTCRLTLRISGVDFIVRRIKTGDRGWSLKRGDGAVYKVTSDRWGVVSCTCPAKGSELGECCHGKALRKQCLIAPSFRAPNKGADHIDCVI